MEQALTSLYDSRSPDRIPLSHFKDGRAGAKGAQGREARGVRLGKLVSKGYCTKKRQRTAALQDASRNRSHIESPPGFGVRLSSAAFLAIFQSAAGQAFKHAIEFERLE